MRDTLCFIPARGGSKRLPGKNLLPLGGKPLLCHTIEAAREAGVFGGVVVSSDDAEILRIAGDYGAAPDRRGPELAGDRIRFAEVLTEYLLRPDQRGRHTKVAVLLPTCPFRTSEDVRQAFALQEETGHAVISVCEYEFPVEFAVDLGEDGRQVHLRNPAAYRTSTQSQSVRKAYHPNGAIYLCEVAAYLASGSFFSDPMAAYVMPVERSLDIDYSYQLAMAEAMLASRRLS